MIMGRKLSFSRRNGHSGGNIRDNLFWVKIKTINIRVIVNVLFNPKNEFMGMGLIHWRKSKNSTQAARIKSKNRHKEKSK